jgi:hypothetical protein
VERRAGSAGRLAQRVMRALDASFGTGRVPGGACSTRPDGGADPLGWCEPVVRDAASNPGWSTFKRWSP